MSSRYMNYLRKNAKVITVFMGIVCMITFVVGTALIDLANSARRSVSEEDRNPIVVTCAPAVRLATLFAAFVSVFTVFF